MTADPDVMIDAESRCEWCGSVFVLHACHMEPRR